MTDLQIRELIADYGVAFSALDATAVARFYDEPSAIVDQNGTAVFADEMAARENAELLTRYYRSMGFTAAEPTRVDIEHVSHEMAEVDVGWTMHLGEARVRFATRYWIVERADGPRIASVLAYSERNAVQDP